MKKIILKQNFNKFYLIVETEDSKLKMKISKEDLKHLEDSLKCWNTLKGGISPNSTFEDILEIDLS